MSRRWPHDLRRARLSVTASIGFQGQVCFDHPCQQKGEAVVPIFLNSYIMVEALVKSGGFGLSTVGSF